jgi:hypothetical protein
MRKYAVAVRSAPREGRRRRREDDDEDDDEVDDEEQVDVDDDRDDAVAAHAIGSPSSPQESRVRDSEA